MYRVVHDRAMNIEVLLIVVLFFCQIVVGFVPKCKLLVRSLLHAQSKHFEDVEFACAPILSLVGHDQHGKSSLLKKLLHTSLSSMHTRMEPTVCIEAYNARIGTSPITMVDTPGHRSYSDMRDLGIELADWILLVVAGDEGVTEQTLECVFKARKLSRQLMIAITKTDICSNDDLGRIEADLQSAGLPTNQICLVSSLNNDGLAELSDQIILKIASCDFSTRAKRPFDAIVLDAFNTKGIGHVTKVLVRGGILRVGDVLTAGTTWGKVKRLLNESTGSIVNFAGPSDIVQIVGLEGFPPPGAVVRCIPSEKEARKISQNSRNIQRPRLSENFRMAIDGTRPSTHPIILKGNSSASLYAVRSLIKSSPSAGAVVRVAHDGVGDVSTSDIDLASTLGAIVLGIGSFYDQSVLNLAKSKNVRLETCASPQLCLERIESIALPMTKKVEKVIIGKALVKKVFQFPVEAVGCELISGIFLKQAVVSIMRGGVMIGTSSIANLRKYKKDVEEVKEGEFGVTLSDKLAVSEGDELISLS